jgi:hypothetical protein
MRDEVISLLLLAAAICGLLYAALFGAGPFVVNQAKVFGPGILQQIDPRWQSAVMLVALVPVPVLCAVASAVFWLARVRPRAARRRELAAIEGRREETLTAWLDRLGSELLAANPGVQLRLAAPDAVLALDRNRRQRLLAFLCEVGLSSEAAGGALADDPPEPELQPMIPNRMKVLSSSGCLLVIGAFLLLWAALVFFANTFSSPLRALGLMQQFTVQEALFGALFCAIPGLGAVLVGGGILWLFRRERLRGRRRDAEHDRRRQAVIAAVEQRIQELIAHHGLRSASGGGVARRIARGRIMAALPALDVHCRGELLRSLVQARLLAPPAALDLAGSDFSGSSLASARLGGAQLAGITLDGANLARADLAAANLRGSRLRAADLRSCDLRGASLRQADLRYARLQRARLRGADLRNCNLDQANLWGVDLSGAELESFRGTPESGLPPAPSAGAAPASRSAGN